MNGTAIIRFVKNKDINQLIDLCEAHSHYEQCEYNSVNKAKRLAEDLFSNPSKLHCLVVEKENALIGYATYMKQYSTWDAQEYVYMDCLFMNESSRGFGLGEKLVKRIQEEGKKLGCNLVQWQTPEFNTRAIKFYHRIGASSKDKKRFFLE